MGVFCRRWGVPLIDGGTVRLQAIVGLGRALDLILTGRPVDATEALGMGLATRVVPPGHVGRPDGSVTRSLALCGLVSVLSPRPAPPSGGLISLTIRYSHRDVTHGSVRAWMLPSNWRAKSPSFPKR